MRILLVDDDWSAMKYLSKMIPWQDGHELIGMLTDGQEALTCIDKHPVDLVITDIRMPAMDGLTLAEHLRKSHPEVLVYLLTAYKDFEYARRAIETRTQGYLLKDEIDSQGMAKILSQCQKILNDLHTNALYKGEGELRDLIHRQKSDTEQLPYCGLRLSVIIPKAGSLLPVTNLPGDLPQVCEPPPISPALHPLYLPVNFGLLIAFRQEELTKNFIRVEEALNMCINPNEWGIVTNCLTRVGALQEAYQALKWASKTEIFLCEKKLFLLDELLSHKGRVEANSEEWKILDTAIHTEDIDTVQTAIEKLFAPFEKIWDVELFTQRVQTLIHWIDRIGTTCAMPTVEQYVSLLNVSLHSVTQIRDFLFERLRSVIGKRAEIRQIGYSPILRKAFRIIQTSYNQDISLQSVAEEIGVSKVYLSQLFRKEAGTTFLDVLTKQRIDQAKRLLIKTNLKIYEIAQRTGFQKGQYFSQVFRQETGKKPLDYRKQGCDEF